MSVGIGSVGYFKGGGPNQSPFTVTYCSDNNVGGFFKGINRYFEFKKSTFFSADDVVEDGIECNHGCRNKDYCREC